MKRRTSVWLAADHPIVVEGWATMTGLPEATTSLGTLAAGTMITMADRISVQTRLLLESMRFVVLKM